jgi:tRNA(Ile)-lysidine synthase
VRLTGPDQHPRPADPAAGPFDLSAFDRRLNPTTAAPVALAYSGGGDSLALLLAAADWARGAGRPVLALHVDHGLQPQSGDWAEAAERTARGLGAEFRLLRWTGDKPCTGVAAAARAARLRLMADAVREAGAQVLLLGHTADDIAEGEAMRAEGSTLGRLREWSPSPVWPEGRGIFHLRPLLGVGREALRGKLAGFGIGWIEDPANEDLHYARARARRALKAAPATPPEPDEADPALAELARATTAEAGGLLSIDRAQLRAAPEETARVFVGMALLSAAGSSRPPRSNSLERLTARLRAGEPVTATLAGARVEANGERVVFGRDAGELRRRGLELMPITNAGAFVWDGRFELETGTQGLVVRALSGLRKLSKAERERLRAMPAAFRPSLPVVVSDRLDPTCPILAEGPVRARALARERLLCATSAVATESQAAALLMAERPVPSYFERE